MGLLVSRSRLQAAAVAVMAYLQGILLVVNATNNRLDIAPQLVQMLIELDVKRSDGLLSGRTMMDSGEVPPASLVESCWIILSRLSINLVMPGRIANVSFRMRVVPHLISRVTNLGFHSLSLPLSRVMRS